MRYYYSYYLLKKYAVRSQWRRKETVNIGKGKTVKNNYPHTFKLQAKVTSRRPEAQCKQKVEGSYLGQTSQESEKCLYTEQVVQIKF